MLGAIALDYSHVMEVKAELQNATDAGALAGAAHLAFDVKNAEPEARKFAAANFADGRRVSSDTQGVEVSVQVLPPTAEKTGKVTVDATIEVGHFLARMFGRFSDTVRAHSVAGTSGSLWRIAADQAFPIAVSLDAIPSYKDFTGVALKSLSIGDSFTIYLGSQGAKNGTFTSFTHKTANANFIGAMIDQSLGIAPLQEGFIPSIKLGDDIYLDNGMIGQLKLSKEPYLSSLAGKTIVLPVIQGGSPYNQTRKVVAFVGYKVTKVFLHQDSGVVERLTGQLVQQQVLGESGPYPAEGNEVPPDVSRITIGPIQLLE
jgi:carbon monoxide dehydrogenase subunit G